MNLQMLLGLAAFVGLFVMFVVLPSKLRKRHMESSESQE